MICTVMLYFIITLSNTLQGVELEKLNANKEADWKPASFFNKIK